MKEITVKVNVRNDFFYGDCDHCPFAYIEELNDEDDGFDWITHCCLDEEDNMCPLERQGALDHAIKRNHSTRKGINNALL